MLHFFFILLLVFPSPLLCYLFPLQQNRTCLKEPQEQQILALRCFNILHQTAVTATLNTVKKPGQLKRKEERGCYYEILYSWRKRKYQRLLEGNPYLILQSQMVLFFAFFHICKSMFKGLLSGGYYSRSWHQYLTGKCLITYWCLMV